MKVWRPPYPEIALDVADPAVVAVFGLLDDRVGVKFEGVDEAALSSQGRCPQSIYPEPINMSGVLIERRMYLLSCNLATNPFFKRQSFVRIVEGVHDDVRLLANDICWGDVGIFVEYKE
jgi:hypothetical protein